MSEKKAKKKRTDKNNQIVLKNGLFGSPVFHGALKEISNSKLHAVTAFKINKLAKLIEKRAQDYHEIRVKFCKELGKESDDKQSFSFPDEKKGKEFVKEMEELGGLDIKLGIEKIKFPESIELTPIQIGTIEDLFTFDED